ncbi:hypothetical protein BJB45_02070 [Halomonas huangheensis]|uniref:Uncharacterized protein n=1 Tax=Halomonas huangheensis TaxID=1178482 RepID=W1N346_9GAMM|nr:hypothetical protein AR456_03580 [Halomonas huangheensis]ERL49933.1 hypothetical protein BJB45_02070 [Halomonas huangheensis]
MCMGQPTTSLLIHVQRGRQPSKVGGKSHAVTGIYMHGADTKYKLLSVETPLVKRLLVERSLFLAREGFEV